MRDSRNALMLVAAAGVIGLGITAAAFARRGAQDSPVQVADGFSWRGSIDSGDVLEIKGVNGPIDVERTSGSQIEVTAQAEGRRSDAKTVTIERVEHEGGITLCAVYPTPAGERENYCAPGDGGHMNVDKNDVQVSFHVLLPEGVTFHGRTVNGSVQAMGLESDVLLTTVNGNVELSTTGRAEATTVNGSIEAAFGDTGPREELTFSTVNGSITLDVPDDIDADLDASWLNGELDSDLPFTLQGSMSKGQARGVIGDGGPLLSLSTVNGSIRLR
ncbi:MAG: DUF4097 family beta strand repeat-containing protein [Gemmatimonadota bacterium]